MYSITVSETLSLIGLGPTQNLLKKIPVASIMIPPVVKNGKPFYYSMLSFKSFEYKDFL